MTKAKKPTRAQLEAIGGKFWERDDMRRVYFDDLPGFLGYDFAYYNTGNISAAWYAGEVISNSDGRRVQSMLNGAKFFYDLSADEWSARFFNQHDKDCLLPDLIRAAQDKIEGLENKGVSE